MCAFEGCLFGHPQIGGFEGSQGAKSGVSTGTGAIEAPEPPGSVDSLLLAQGLISEPSKSKDRSGEESMLVSFGNYPYAQTRSDRTLRTEHKASLLGAIGRYKQGSWPY